MARTYKAQVLKPGRLPPRELRLKLSKVRQAPVPANTLKWWRKQLGITPDEDGCYGLEEYEILKGLVRWLQRGGNVSAYVSILKENLNGD